MFIFVYLALNYLADIVFFTAAVFILLRIARALQNIRTMLDALAPQTPRNTNFGPPQS